MSPLICTHDMCLFIQSECSTPDTTCGRNGVLDSQLGDSNGFTGGSILKILAGAGICGGNGTLIGHYKLNKHLDKMGLIETFDYKLCMYIKSDLSF